MLASAPESPVYCERPENLVNGWPEFLSLAKLSGSDWDSLLRMKLWPPGFLEKFRGAFPEDLVLMVGLEPACVDSQDPFSATNSLAEKDLL